MKSLRTMLLATCAVLLGIAGPRSAWALHLDVLVQQQDGQLVTGTADFDSGQWIIGQRVFSREFDSDYLVNNPGFNALASGSPSLPAGTQALPGSTSLGWDFLPMQINDLTANLFYWDGLAADGMPGTTPDDVGFGPLPASGTPGGQYSFTLFDKNNVAYSVDGANKMIAGGLIARTSSDGSLHQHDYFSLDEGSGYLGTAPADGIYLVGMQMRMAGLENSLPIFLLFGTPGSTFEALNDAAEPWVLDRVDTLVASALPGDYNGNGVIDAADYTVWRDAVTASATTLPNDPTPGAVDESDFAYWRAHFGEALAPGGVRIAGQRSYVPEPMTATMLLEAVLAFSWVRLRLHQAKPRC